MKRDFIDATIIPSTKFVCLDGEGYHCASLDISNIKGTTREVPADRILAIHWYGNHGHGHVEGFGAAEGFDDRTQVEPYVGPWLVARAKAKREYADALHRRQNQEDQEIARSEEARKSTEQLIADLKEEMASSSEDRRVQVQSMIDVANVRLNLIIDTVKTVQGRRVPDDQISAASAAADLSASEVP